MLSGWRLSGKLRWTISSIPFTGKEISAYLGGPRDFNKNRRSGRLCTSSSSSYKSASSLVPPRISVYAILSRTLSTSAESLGERDPITFGEAKRLMRLVNVEALKKKLEMEEKEVIGYKALLEVCERVGVARSPHEAAAFARVLDEAGVILLFRDKVYLHPDKVADLVRRAVPFCLAPEDDLLREELEKLQEKKEEIDLLAHRQVRRTLWLGYGVACFLLGLFLRLTFWEFSWDVMGPIAFFTTTAGIVIGYAYFLFTSRYPTYQDFMKRLFLWKQRRLIKRHDFDVHRLVELKKMWESPLDANSSLKNRVGVDLDLEDVSHKH